ncbi:MAG TPA: DUF4129 domain-containing protein, partial [Thermoplasmata archaeon]|nr:DUF4129 domain-containing protein [Thermoplasmata archaeon]
QITLSSWITPVAGAIVLCAFGGLLVLTRLSGSGSSSSMNRLAVTALMVILLLVLFVILADALGFGLTPGPSNNGTGRDHNSTLPPPTGGHNLTGPGGYLVNFPGMPPWLPFVAIAGITLVVVFLVVPGVRDYMSTRRGTGSHAGAPAAAMGVREVLAHASNQLDSGADPREVIMTLYAAILARLQPMVAELDAITPEEIRAWHLERLGVRAEAAHTLTRLFEEARYSTHPMGPEASRRAREAVQSALDDLDRRNFAA